MHYRVGFDLGFTSIGWAIIILDENLMPTKIEDFGVRIFPSGREAKTNKPTSVNRREKRGASRNHDRYIMRRKTLLKYMILIGLQPQTRTERSELAKTNPYELRDKAVKKQISLYEIGRVLFHINQRRGFKSNLVADQRADKSEQKGLKKGIDDLEKMLEDTEMTLGQFLYLRLQSGKPTRMKANNNEYEIYTNRTMYQQEVDQILAVQKKFHPGVLTNDAIQKLKDIIFFQRPLKLPEPGFCSLINGEKRARSAYVEVQHFRIFQEVNHLDFVKENQSVLSMTQDQKQKIINHLTKNFSELRKDKILSWTKIRKLLGSGINLKFNMEESRDGLKADTTSALLQPILSEIWADLSLANLRKLVDIIVTGQNNSELNQKLNKFFSEVSKTLSDDQINQLIQTKSRLAPGFGHVSLKAIQKIMPHLKTGIIYSDACTAAGINHSDQRTGELFPFGNLPYYGEALPKAVIGGTFKDKNKPEEYFGKINNPTVHMALNQFKIIINELVKKYGEPPKQIHIELARNVTLGTKQLSELKKNQAANQKENQRINAFLTEHGHFPSYNNRMKYKLWEDLAKQPEQRCCPLTGDTINDEYLFSPLVEIEHIIPFSRSFDDSRNNKMLCFQRANRFKGNKTPYEAFGHSPDEYNWDDIIARAKNMERKFWRFLPDAIERFKDSKEGQYIQRQLNDTRYMSKLAHQYAEFVSGPHTVKAIKGKFTSDLRHHWGLEQFTHNMIGGKFTKDRTQHHHHAIDAIVVALTDTSAMRKLARANQRARKQESHKLMLDLEPPFQGFDLEKIKLKLQNMIISHKLDHKGAQKAIAKGATTGSLHEDTNYGQIDGSVYAIRKDLTADNFKKLQDIKEIASKRIREDISRIFENFGDTKKEYESAIEQYKENSHNNPYQRLKKVRVHVKKDSLIPIKDRNNKAYRHVIGGNNFCVEIWCPTKGKKAGKWQCEVVQTFYANQKEFLPQWRKDNPTAYKVMRLQINDMVAIDKNNERQICRVQKLSAKGQIVLRHHNDATTKQKTQTNTSSSSLQKYNARKLFVSPIGKIYDPGHAKKH